MQVNYKFNIFVLLATVLVWLFVPASTRSANNSVLCIINKPLVSDDNIVLSSLVVTGPKQLQVGDKVDIGFVLENANGSDLPLGQAGIFVKAIKPNGSNQQSDPLTADQSLPVKTPVQATYSLVLDQPGKWNIFPSYNILVWQFSGNLSQGNFDTYQEKFGPDFWGGCQLEVVEILDQDQDGINDDQDNCKLTFNPDQADVDQDGIGDKCDPFIDSDQDKVADSQDNCPEIFNPNQADKDSDGIGDACDKVDDSVPLSDNQPTDQQPSDDTAQDNNDADQDGAEISGSNNKPEADNIQAEGVKIRQAEIPVDLSSDIDPDQNRTIIRVDVGQGVKAGLIDIFVNGEKARSCFARSSCAYVTPVMLSTPIIGARVVTEDGAVADIGDGIPGWRGDVLQEQSERDDDNDGVANLFDNCISVANPDQSDFDGDGVGDACDLCDAGAASLRECSGGPGAEYTCSVLTDRTFELRTRDDRYYYDIIYDVVDQEGCGVKKEFDVFKQERLVREKVTKVSLGEFRGSELCSFVSDCEVVGGDTCLLAGEPNQIGSAIREFGVFGRQIGSVDIECPRGCLDGQCFDPDSDGGIKYFQRGEVRKVNRGSFDSVWADFCFDDRGPKLREFYFDKDYFNLYRRFDEEAVKFDLVDCPWGCFWGRCVRPVDTDGGIEPTVFGKIEPEDIDGSLEPSSPPVYEDYCADDRTVVEYYIEERFGDGELDPVRTRNITCEGVCVNGACQEPTCSDGILNQGEESIDTGGPCSSGEFVYITGRLLYEEGESDFNNIFISKSWKPVRYVKVELKKENGDPAWATAFTDRDGYFRIAVNRSDFVGRNYYLKFKAEIPGIVRVHKDFDGCNEYVWWETKNKFTVPERGDVELGNIKIRKDYNIDVKGYWQETDDLFCGGERQDIIGGAAYFNILEAIRLARGWVDGKRADDDVIARVDVAYPDVGPFGFVRPDEVIGTPWQNPFDDEIYLAGPVEGNNYLDYGYRDGTIIHEYAHHLAEQISENDWALDSHYFCKRTDEEFAWFEGFAAFLGHYLINLYRNIPGYELDLRYIPERIVEAPEQAVCYGKRLTYDKFGPEVEGIITAFLWDLTDKEGDLYYREEMFDRLENRAAEIIAAFDTEIDNLNDAPDVCEFIGGDQGLRERLRRSGGEEAVAALDDLIDHYNFNCG